MNWEGIIGVFYTEYKDEEIPENIKKLKEKLDYIGNSSDLIEIRER